MKGSRAKCGRGWKGVILGLLLAGCAVETLERQDRITGLRIVAIRAEPPEAAPGSEVQLSALVVSPKGAAIRLQWFACASPSQANLGCAERSDATALGTQDTVKYTIPAAFFPAKPSLLQLLQGVYLPITLVAQAEGEKSEAVKRVVVSLAPTNKNPEITDVGFFEEGKDTPLTTPWTAKAGGRYTFRPTVPEASRQMYPALTFDGKFQDTKEALFFSWFSTTGSLQGRTSDETEPSKVWQAPTSKEAAGVASKVFVILRDGRGGTTWREASVAIQP